MLKFFSFAEIRLFCFTTAIAMGLDYLLELILFGPILALATKCEKAKFPVTKPNLDSLKMNDAGWRIYVNLIIFLNFSPSILQIYRN